MTIQTKYHGEQVLTPEQIIVFPKGVPGFPNETEFVILPLTDDKSFAVLQSVATAGLAFVITNPFVVYQDYNFSLDDEIADKLTITEDNLVVFSIVTAKEPFETSTINLQAPVIINIEARRGKQVILNNSPYATRAPLFPLVESKEE